MGTKYNTTELCAILQNIDPSKVMILEYGSDEPTLYAFNSVNDFVNYARSLVNFTNSERLLSKWFAFNDTKMSIEFYREPQPMLMQYHTTMYNFRFGKMEIYQACKNAIFTTIGNSYDLTEIRNMQEFPIPSGLFLPI